jgi:cytochrome c oxidase cbb3-type subunit 3
MQMRLTSAVMPRAALAALVALALAACGGGKDAEKNGDQKGELAGQSDRGGSDSANAVQVASNRASLAAFSGDVQAARQGRQLFINNNCYSCHGGLAGGAMGPSLRDTTWLYGGTEAAIVATLKQGRPAGMPSYSKLLSEPEMRQIATYIKSLRTQAEPTFFFAMDDTTTHAGTLEQ